MFGVGHPAGHPEGEIVPPPPDEGVALVHHGNDPVFEVLHVVNDNIIPIILMLVVGVPLMIYGAYRLGVKVGRKQQVKYVIDESW
jgi:hypothetical protein